MIDELKQLANKRDVPYQSLMKLFLAERIQQELNQHKASWPIRIQRFSILNYTIPYSPICQFDDLRITLDIAETLVNEIDRIRESIGVDRSALIKIWLHERIQKEKGLSRDI